MAKSNAERQRKLNETRRRIGMVRKYVWTYEDVWPTVKRINTALCAKRK